MVSSLLLQSLIFCSRWVVLIPLTIWLFNYKKYSKIQKFLGFQFGLAIVTESVSLYLARSVNNNMLLYHPYVVFELIIFSVLFRFLLAETIKGRVIYITAAVFTLLAILNGYYIQPLSKLPTNTRTLESLILLAYALAGFYKLFMEMKMKHIEKSFEFWVYSGVLIYFSGNLFLFILSNTILKNNPNLHRQVWIVLHSSFNIILYLSLAIALWHGANTGRKHLLYSFRRHRGNVPPRSGHHSLCGDLPEKADPPPA